MKKYKIIVNPAAGRGRSKDMVPTVAGILRARGVLFDLEQTSGPDAAQEVARKACSEFDVIVIMGGDGSVNSIIPGMLFSSKPLGIIPAGTGNDFIKSLNIPNTISGAVDVVLRGATRTIDVGRINSTYFVNGVGIGFDAAVNRASHTMKQSSSGLHLYLFALAKTLGKYLPVAATLRINGEVIHQKIFFLTIGNGTTCGGGFKLTPHAKVDDQLLAVTIVGPMSVGKLLWHLPKVFQGTIGRVRSARLMSTRKLTVESSTPMPIHVDGDIYPYAGTSVEIDVVPRALTVLGGV